MTGEITLRGRVLPIGGLKSKLLAAHLAGVKTVLIPQRNEKDLVDSVALGKETFHSVGCEACHLVEPSSTAVSSGPNLFGLFRPDPRMREVAEGADGRRFHDAYFAENEGFWTHGDAIEIAPRGSARILGRTGRPVSVIGLGTWQLGADWGEVDPADARAVLETSLEAGVTFYDTADVYGDGRSERFLGEFRAAHPDAGITIATKLGRRVPQEPANYTLDNFRSWTSRSRRNLGVDMLDLVQLHCPPTAVYQTDTVFDALDTLVDEGAIAAYGVSVEETAQALTAIERPAVATVQIILTRSG